MVAITEDRLTVGRADMAWCRDLSGEIEHASGGTASNALGIRATKQQTSNPSEESAAAGSVRRAANVMTHVSVEAWVSLLHRWRGRLPDLISASCIMVYAVY